MLTRILPLGDPRLYEKCAPLTAEDLPEALAVAAEMHGLIRAFCSHHGWGRAMAAPQIGYMKRLICMYVEEPQVFINPVLHDLSPETFELWDDCMCFPDLMVRLRRHRTCRMTFLDPGWQEHTWDLADDLSELMQHEYDHLEGVLATQHAAGPGDLALRRWVKGELLI
jgi:peptide deformylase